MLHFNGRKTMSRFTYFCLIVFCIASAAVRADIFQWEYIDPGNPSQGKRQSATLCVDGADQVPAPESSLYGNLTMAYLIGADLRTSFADSANQFRVLFRDADGGELHGR
jgi:hypothetical protein